MQEAACAVQAASPPEPFQAMGMFHPEWLTVPRMAPKEKGRIHLHGTFRCLQNVAGTLSSYTTNCKAQSAAQKSSLRNCAYLGELIEILKKVSILETYT